MDGTAETIDGNSDNCLRFAAAAPDEWTRALLIGPRVARALDPLVVDRPARLTKQPGDLAIAVAAVLSSQLDDIGREPFLILTTTRDFALRRAVLSERRTGAALGHMQLRSHLLNAGSATRGA